jgi:hypothetical protein
VADVRTWQATREKTLAAKEKDRADDRAKAAIEVERKANDKNAVAIHEQERTSGALHSVLIGHAKAQVFAHVYKIAKESLDATPRNLRDWEYRYLHFQTEATPLGILGYKAEGPTHLVAYLG